MNDPSDIVISTPDSVAAGIRVYPAVTVHGVRSTHVTATITLHLDGFQSSGDAAFGHDRISTGFKRNVVLATGTTLRRDKGRQVTRLPSSRYHCPAVGSFSHETGEQP